ncbi:AfsR/SARP family transcriptional regulator [Gordonia polyisoprenivorans]|uniref:AfsR/SARP family transcriptional regulator n=1 Tax=Gordonia polyisoprenivorans TaxID=84595 RepID=UPI00036815CA|nr:BTAD domain-containing putative transcriptional regulator [Gordonia polyisoprenivorans]
MYVIRDLGEMVVWRDGVIVNPGGTKPRTILALLCAHAGRPVPASTLIAEVWGADAPAKTQRALESQMWRLRKALVPEGFPPVIITERAGYRLDLDEVSVDSIDFETAGVAVLSGAVVDPSALDAVLSTWRGEPFTTAAPSPGLDQARRQLDVIRTALLTRRADLSAESGQYHRAIDEAQALITRDPLDEHAWALKITVLAATGQRAEAFTAYRDVRELLATELGVTPGDEIRAAHRHALGQHNRSVRRLHLPSQHTSFVGRTSELAETVRLLESDRAVSLDGIPGVGKTRLALEAARRVADSFDDGVWFIDRSTDAGVAETVLTTMRIQPAADSTAGLDQVCDHLATMSVLLVLDGPMSSEDVDVVDAILQRCAAVTILGSSGPMGVRGERVLTVHPLTVDSGRTGGPSPAQQLLVDRIRVARGVFDPDPADLDDLDRICTAMGGLPLGLELAAARMATFSVREVADQFGSAVPEPIDRAFRLAHESLDVGLARRYLRLTALRSPFTSELAEAVCGADVADDLAELCRRSLLWPIRGDRLRPTRFTILDTIAEHARVLDRPAALEAVRRRDHAVTALLATTPMHSTMSSARDLARVDNDVSTVLAFLESVVSDPARLDTHIDLIEQLGPYWYLCRRLAAGIRLLRIASETCSRGGCSARTSAMVTACLSAASAFSQQTAEAHRHLTALSPDDLDAAIVVDDQDPDVGCRRFAFLALASWTGDDHALAGIFAQRAWDALVTGSREAAIVTATKALCELTVGNVAEGTHHAHTALALGAELGDPLAIHLAAVMLGIRALLNGDTRMGLRWNDQAFHAYLDAGGVQICDTVEQRGNHLAAAGEVNRAGRAFAVARTYALDAGMEWPRHPFTHDAIRRCRDDENTAFDQGWRAGIAEARDALVMGDHERFAGM